MKKFLMGFALGFLAAMVLMFIGGCGDETMPEPDATVVVDAGVDVMPPDTSPPEPDLMVVQHDPVQACYDVAQWLSDKMLECSGSQHDAASFKKYLETVWDCPSSTGIRDAVELYTVCQPAIKNMTCADFEAANSPPSCKSQLI